MTDINLYLILATTSLAAVAMVTTAALAGWRGWLSLKRQQMDLGGANAVAVPNAGTRIEMADLKERIRKLEAIAAGVEL